jgi:hypothetical protein
MAKIIIGIHGLGNKPEQSLLEQWWIKSIKEGLDKSGLIYENIPFKLVYWADILYTRPENPDIKDEDDPHYLSEPYISSKPEIHTKPDPETLSAKILKYIEEQLDKIFLREDMTLNFNNVTDRIIHNYFKDLEIYYSKDSVYQSNPPVLARKVIRQRLLDVLKKHCKDEILLIAHSMGSIIAYDVLVNHKDECKVNTFVTVGSPLGIPIIISRIFEEHKSLKVPANITSKWHNLSDPEDLVAMDHTLQDDFHENPNNIVIHDILVYNDYQVNGKKNPHKIYGYLRTPEMAKIITTFLKVERNAFVKTYYNVIGKVNDLYNKALRREKK